MSTPELERPEHFFAYTVFDLGFIDRTGGLFGLHDYANDLILIEDESLLVKPSSREIADEVNAKELELWPENPRNRITRVMDAAPFVLGDIESEHRLHFDPPDKSGIEAKVSYVQGANNYANLLISGGRVRVHERCTNLRRQLKNAIWNKHGNDFERDKREGAQSMGHFDLAAAFVYLCRAVDRKRNPFPAGWKDRHRGARQGGTSVWAERKQDLKAQNQGLFPNTALFRRLAQRKR